MDWYEVEKLCKESLPSCVKKILSWSGYNTILSLQAISSESLLQIETHINIHCLGMIKNLDCCYSEFYSEQKLFKLLPGHQDLILEVAKVIKCQLHDQLSQNSHFSHESNKRVTCGVSVKNAYDFNEYIKKHCGLSTIMKELIQTALKNSKSHKNHAEYSDILRFFATYIFLLCGRSCYKVLCDNLPFPSISTV